jgi:hypothetical protein
MRTCISTHNDKANIIKANMIISENFSCEEVSNRRCRQEDNIKMDLQEVGYGCMDSIDLAQDRDRWRGTCKCGNKLSGSIKRGKFLD